MIKFLIASIIVCLTNIAFACTSFGVITESSVIMGKNRDSVYGKQTQYSLMILATTENTTNR
jgi:hypothetical protein